MNFANSFFSPFASLEVAERIIAKVCSVEFFDSVA